MKTEEKSTKRFLRRGNVLDLAIILLLLAALITVGYRYYQVAHTGEGDLPDRIRITFEVGAMSPEAAGALQKKDVIYLEDGTTLGRILAHPLAGEESPLLTENAKLTLQDQDGEYVEITVEDGTLLDVIGMAECAGTTNEDGDFLLGGRQVLTPGQVLVVHTTRVSFTLTITAIEPLSH